MAFAQIFKKLASSQAGRGAARGGAEQTDLYNVGAQLGFQQAAGPKASTPQMTPEQSEAILQQEFAALANDLGQRGANAGLADANPGLADRPLQQPGPMAQMANPGPKVSPQQLDAMAQIANPGPKVSPQQPGAMAQMANPGPKMSPKQMMEEAAYNEFEGKLNANLKQSPLMKGRDYENQQSLARKK